MLTLSSQSLAKNKSISLDLDEQSNLAQYIKQCEIYKMDLIDAEKTLSQCSSKDYIAPAWWQTSSGVVSISIVTLLVGFTLGTK